MTPFDIHPSLAPIVEPGNVRFAIIWGDASGVKGCLSETYTETHVAIQALMHFAGENPAIRYQLLQLHTGPWIVYACREAELHEEERRKGPPPFVWGAEGMSVATAEVPGLHDDVRGVGVAYVAIPTPSGEDPS